MNLIMRKQTNPQSCTQSEDQADLKLKTSSLLDRINKMANFNQYDEMALIIPHQF